MEFADDVPRFNRVYVYVYDALGRFQLFRRNYPNTFNELWPRANDEVKKAFDKLTEMKAFTVKDATVSEGDVTEAVALHNVAVAWINEQVLEAENRIKRAEEARERDKQLAEENLRKRGVPA